MVKKREGADWGQGGSVGACGGFGGVFVGIDGLIL